MATSPPSPGRVDRRAILASLAALTALAWIALVPLGEATMPPMPGMAMAPGIADLALGFAMWAAMMPGMMLPSAAPMTLMLARIHTARAPGRGAAVPLAAFLAGYLVVWTGFAALAAAAQWGLARAGLAEGMDGAVGRYLGAAIFLLAGAYQFSPLKLACLGACRSPLGFLMTQWRDGAGGALRMGLRHGAICLGCCWALMALLFAVGAMNLLWVAGLGALVLIEKLAPGGGWIARAGGIALIAAGIAIAA
ncbi:MAG: DUF2182 domain-containing protein [Rhodospirillales bacterium]|nr:DUF2182 domain-containing protein [Rhodospirillales bacterium]